MLRDIEYVISKIIKKMHFKAIKNSVVNKTAYIGAGTNFINSKIDRHSYCGYDCTIIDSNIGSFCSIANNCHIGGAAHTMDWVSTSPVFNNNKGRKRKKYSHHEYNPYAKTIVGHDVWIGEKCLIKAGVGIGTGSIIGMGSVVTKDVPPYEIWAGNPAKFIRKRFTSSISEKLLESEWWSFEDKKLKRIAEHICDVDVFLEHTKD